MTLHDPPRVHPSSASRSRPGGCLPGCSHCKHGAANGLAQRPARRPLARARVRRVAADGRAPSSCAGGGEPGRRRSPPRQPDVAGRGQLRQVPGRVEAEPVAERERAEQEQRPGEARAEHGQRAPRSAVAAPAAARARRAATAAGRSARTGSSRRRGARRPPSASSARGRAGELLGRRTGPRGTSRCAGDEPAEHDEDGERQQRRSRASRSPARAPGGAAPPAPPARRRTARTARTGRRPEPEAEPAAVAAQRRAPAGCAGAGSARRGRPPTARNGSSAAISTSSIAQPRHDPRAEVDVAGRSRRELERPASSEPRSSCAARPIWPSRVASSRAGWSANAVGGRSPPVVSVIAGMPRASERPLLVEAEREAEVDELPERAGCAGRAAGLLEHALRRPSRRAPARRAAARRRQRPGAAGRRRRSRRG